MSTDIENDDLRKRLSLSLLLVRIVTFAIFGAYGYATIIRPMMNADQLGKIYYISGMPSGVMVVLGIIQLIIAIAVLLGIYKKVTRAALVVLAALSVIMPTYLVGFFTATIGGVPHPFILYFTNLCLFGCAFMIFKLRDLDTMASLNIGDK